MLRFLFDYTRALLAATGFFALPVGLAVAAPAGGTRSASRLMATLGLSEAAASWILTLIIAGAWIVSFIVAAWVVARVLTMLAQGYAFDAIVLW